MAHRPRSLRLELIATLTVVVVMAVVSLSLAGELLGRSRHQAQQDARLVEHTRSLAAIVGPLLEPGALGGLHGGPVEQVLRPSVGSMGIEAIEIHRLDLQRSRNDVLVSLGLAPALPVPSPDADGRIEAIDGELKVVDQALRVFGPERRRTALVLRVIARPSPWSRLGDFRTTLLLAGGVGLVLVVLGGVLLEVQTLRPLRAVRRAADEVANGRLDTEVPAEGPAELLALADAFNRMTASLRHQIDQNVAQRESLVRAEQLASVGRLSAGVAHEVGNPLAAVLGYVELLLDPRSEPALEQDERALLERCRTQLERIQGIVGQLLDYSRPAEGRSQTVMVHDAMQQLLSLLRHDPRCRDVTLRLHGDEAAEALADPAHLDQVVQNLVVNACRAATSEERSEPATQPPTEPPTEPATQPPTEPPTGPLVEVRIAAEADAVTIEIQDTGPGVPDEVRPRLFEPFVTTARAGEGTGLGLAISRGLMDGMQGRLVCLEPDARPPLRPGASPGAVFRVILRRSEPRPEPHPKNAEATTAVEGGP